MVGENFRFDLTEEMGMQHVTCPACGWQTLDSVSIVRDGTDIGLAPRQGTVLFECNRCAWFGTAMVGTGPQNPGVPAR